jgi:oligopeptide transport system ATP-binding protein
MLASGEDSLMTAPLLAVRHLKKHFPLRAGLFTRSRESVYAVNDVSFELDAGETLGLVGESGCGKTTVGLSVLRLIEPTAGEILFEGKDLRALDPAGLRPLRRRMQIIFQDPFSSLNPWATVAEIVGEGLDIHGLASGKKKEERVAAILRKVGLKAEHLGRYPHAFSGGQRQRIGIARALVLNPDLVIADEPVSALDVSIQAQVINLMKDLQAEFHFALIMVAHDLSVVAHMSDRVAVMYLGRIVELAPCKALFASSRHPYTTALMSAIPDPNPHSRKRRILLEGDVPSPTHPPAGCVFGPRCFRKTGGCDSAGAPPLTEVEPGHFVACHFPLSKDL